jgi:hypothetical protein
MRIHNPLNELRYLPSADETAVESNLAKLSEARAILDRLAI